MSKKIYYIPLYNFNIRPVDMTLAPGISINILSNEQHDQITRLQERRSNIRSGIFILNMELDVQDEVVKHNNGGCTPRNKAELVLTSLRLFKEQIVGFNLIVEPDPSDAKLFSATHLQHYETWINPKYPLKYQKYTLDPEESIRFIDFYKLVSSTDRAHLDLALYYFNKSYIEPYAPRDSVLDLVIALENLFLRKEQKELSYKFRTRIAWYLGKDAQERQHLYIIAKKAYNLRSSIVHGDSTPDIDIPFFFELRKLSRRSLLKMLQNPNHIKNLDEWVLQIDMAMIENS